VGFGHTVKGTYDTPLSASRIMYNGRDLNREKTSV